MVKACSALGCSNRDDRKGKENGYSFHIFPKNADLRKAWAIATRRQGKVKGDIWKPTKFSYLCSKHFKVEDFTKFGAHRKLLPDAVPSVFDFTNYLMKREKKNARKNKSQAGTNQGLHSSECHIQTIFTRTDCNVIDMLISKNAQNFQYNLDKLSRTCEENRIRINIKQISQAHSKGKTQETVPDSTVLDITISLLDEGIYPETGATTLCSCDLPEKLDDNTIVRLATEYSDSLSGIPTPRSKHGPRTKRKDCVSTRSLTPVVEQLKSAHQEIKQLVLGIRIYEQEHAELHMERANTLIRSVHLIKRDAVNGDINAIMLLNQIAVYVPQE